MGPTVEAIKALGGSGIAEEIAEKVITILGIPDELVARPYITKRGNQDPRTQLAYELAWAGCSLATALVYAAIRVMGLVFRS